MPKQTRLLAVAILPTLLVSLLYYVLLGHRRDYLGHYAAGYGGTLCACAIVLACLPDKHFRRVAHPMIAFCTIICIVAGAGAEATVFRLAKFDEIDFCNQSLGATLAGLAAISFSSDTKTEDADLRCLIFTGAIFLIMGGYFAVT